ncbi:MAG: hypothetical protein ACYC5G_00250 [Candidatus Doudnabacteria bacterium]
MKKTTLGLGALVLALATTGLVASSALAYQGDSSVKGPNYSPERHAAMETAFENNDYNAWKNLMAGKGNASQIITQDNFAKFAQAHKLAEQGNVSEAQKILKDLGLGLHNGTGYGKNNNQHNFKMGVGRNFNR